MSNFIEGLCHIEEDCRTVLVIVECLVYSVDYAVFLLYGGVCAAESKLVYIKVKDKAIHVTGREGPQGCETSRIPHFV
jgi:hypothetical protein